MSNLGIKHGYRSGLEDATADFLRARGIPARYEEEKIRYLKPAKLSTYTPDFVIEVSSQSCPYCADRGDRDQGKFTKGNMPAVCPHCEDSGQYTQKLIIETKGWFKTDDRMKHLEIKRQFPHLDIRFVFQNSNARISKRSKTTYADWCRKHGFLFADKSIPEEWIKDVIKINAVSA